MTAPTLQVERALLHDGARLVCGMDEVGRGAIAGPVHVGVVCVTADTVPLDGVRDSKLLSPSARADLAPRIRTWAVAWGVGSATAGEVDEVGIIGALRRAGHRALAALKDAGHVPDLVLLDGRHDWLTPPAPTLMDDEHESAVPCPRVVTRVKADLTCLSVAAASVLAKVERDGVMAELSRAFPGYGWEANKGYAAAEHMAALQAQGVSTEHRRSWSIPGREVPGGEGGS